MAGGKLTPRQKMVNLMYLVFVAMLAMNMSKEVLSAFGILNDKITESNGIAEARNQSAFDQLAQKAQDQPKQYGDKKAKVDKIRLLCKDFYSYIEGLKTIIKSFPILAEEEVQTTESLLEYIKEQPKKLNWKLWSYIAIILVIFVIIWKILKGLCLLIPLCIRVTPRALHYRTCLGLGQRGAFI